MSDGVREGKKVGEGGKEGGNQQRAQRGKGKKKGREEEEVAKCDRRWGSGGLLEDRGGGQTEVEEVNEGRRNAASH